MPEARARAERPGGEEAGSAIGMAGQLESHDTGRRPASVRTRVFLFGLVAFVSTAAVQDDPRVNAHAAMLQRFKARVDAYLELQREASRSLPPLKETDDPAQIADHERQLARAIQHRRRHATRGEVFGADMGAYVRQLVRADWAERSPDARRALMEDMPKRVPAVVNMPYPAGLPLVTTPPDLLEVLPDLPESLEYRLYSRHVILRDAKAGLIVDLLDDVIRW